MGLCRWPPFALSALLCLSVGCGACHAASPDAAEEEPPSPRQAGLFVWHELAASDPEAEAAFYVDVVGWRAIHEPQEHITLVGDFGEVAGVSRLSPALKARGVTPRWIGRVAVLDVDATVAKTRVHGGQVPLEPMELPDFRFAILEDPAGTSLQVASVRGRRAQGDRGRVSEFAWDELTTPDGSGALEFYAAVLGWKPLVETSIRDAVRYVTLGRGDTPAAGVFADPSLRRQDWVSYVRIRDLDLALARATRRGAAILVGPQAVPDGRMAQLRDPEGAIVGLRERSENAE